MADIASQFFSPWDPPPPFAAEPADHKKAEVVQKLAQYAVKNGASFVELIKTKQQDNPEYRFLFGGENADYYLWVLYCSLHNMPCDQPDAAANQNTAQPQQPVASVQDVESMLQQTAASCPVEVRTGFSQVLTGLTGSKVHVNLLIRCSASWCTLLYNSGMLGCNCNSFGVAPLAKMAHSSVPHMAHSSLPHVPHRTQ